MNSGFIPLPNGWWQEFRAQCFGGDYTGEVYDHVLKKWVLLMGAGM